MVIRPIEPHDDAAIAAIVRRSLEAHGLDIPGTACYDPELDHLSAQYEDGIARALVAAVEGFAREAGFSTLYLETHHDLDAAAALYRTLGYRETGEPLPGSPHTTMEVFFEKEL